VVESLEQGKGLEPLIVWLNRLDQPKPTPAQVGVINRFLMSINDPKALAAVMRSANDKGLTMSEDKLKAIRVPMLAIIGDQDPLKKGIPELKKLVPHLQVVEIAGGDHISTFLNPEFLKSLKNFLAKNRDKAASEKE
jgi:pimeloyl-ACP methyl ester carboxylesterase